MHHKRLISRVSLSLLISMIITVTSIPLLPEGSYQPRIRNALTIQRGPIPGLDASTPYCFYYGKLTDCVVDELIKRFKLVILHPGINEPWVTPEQVSRLKAAGIIVIVYIPFGEDYIVRSGNGRGPVYYDDQNCSLVDQNKGYASWYLDEVDLNGILSHDGIPDKNWTYGSYFVNAGDPAWQEFVRSATIATDGFAGTEYILNHLGADGLFIDVIETASPWLGGDGRYFYTWRGAFDLLCGISDLYPEKYMVVNRPLFACDLNNYPMTDIQGLITCCSHEQGPCSQFCFCDFSSPNDARNRFRQCINAFVWESYSLDRQYPDFPNTRNNIRECSDNTDGYGFNVMVLDYHNLIQGLYPCMDSQIKEVNELGWLN